MDSTLYSVVYFNDDNTVECVPKSWIKNGTCAWPSKHINARKIIEQNCTPNKNEFNFYKIRELCSNISKFDFVIFSLKNIYVIYPVVYW